MYEATTLTRKNIKLISFLVQFKINPPTLFFEQQTADQGLDYSARYRMLMPPIDQRYRGDGWRLGREAA